MARTGRAAVTVQVGVGQPAVRIVPAIEAVLTEWERRPQGLSLSIDLAGDLQAPVEMTLAVPVAVAVSREPQSGEFAVRVSPRTRQHFYPSFRGMLRVTPQGADSSVVTMHGTYTVPLGAVGQTLDVTLLRGTAESSLRRFLSRVVEEASARIAI